MKRQHGLAPNGGRRDSRQSFLPKIFKPRIPAVPPLSAKLGIPLFSLNPDEIPYQISAIEVRNGRNWRDFSSLGRYIEEKGAFKDILFKSRVHPLYMTNIEKLKDRLTRNSKTVSEYKLHIDKARELRERESIPRLKESRAYFKDSFLKLLAAPSTHIRTLTKRLPNVSINFDTLNAFADENVPVLRAIWFIKLVYLNKYPENQEERTLSFSKEMTSYLEELTGRILHEELTEKREARMRYFMRLVFWDVNSGIFDRIKIFRAIVHTISRCLLAEGREVADRGDKQDKMRMVEMMVSRRRVFVTSICASALASNIPLLLAMPHVAVELLEVSNKIIQNHELGISVNYKHMGSTRLLGLIGLFKTFQRTFQAYFSREYDAYQIFKELRGSSGVEYSQFEVQIEVSSLEYKLCPTKGDISNIIFNVNMKSFLRGLLQWVLGPSSASVEAVADRIPTVMKIIDACVAREIEHSQSSKEIVNEQRKRRERSRKVQKTATDYVLWATKAGKRSDVLNMASLFILLVELQKDGLFDFSTFIGQSIARGILDGEPSRQFLDFLLLYALYCRDEESALQLRSSLKFSSSGLSSEEEETFISNCEHHLPESYEDPFAHVSLDTEARNAFLNASPHGSRDILSVIISFETKKSMKNAVRAIAERIAKISPGKTRKLDENGPEGTVEYKEEEMDHVITRKVRDELISSLDFSCSILLISDAKKIGLLLEALNAAAIALSAHVSDVHVCEECKNEAMYLAYHAITHLRNYVLQGIMADESDLIGQKMLRKLRNLLFALLQSDGMTFLCADLDGLIHSIELFLIHWQRAQRATKGGNYSKRGAANGNSSSFLSVFSDFWTAWADKEDLHQKYEPIELPGLGECLSAAERPEDVEDALGISMRYRQRIAREKMPSPVLLGIPRLYRIAIFDILHFAIFNVPKERTRAVLCLASCISPRFTDGMSLQRIFVSYVANHFIPFCIADSGAQTLKPADSVAILCKLVEYFPFIPFDVLLQLVVASLRDYSHLNGNLLAFTRALLFQLDGSSEGYRYRKFASLVVQELALVSESDEGLHPDLKTMAGDLVADLLTKDWSNASFGHYQLLVGPKSRISNKKHAISTNVANIRRILDARVAGNLQQLHVEVHNTKSPGRFLVLANKLCSRSDACLSEFIESLVRGSGESKGNGRNGVDDAQNVGRFYLMTKLADVETKFALLAKCIAKMKYPSDLDAVNLKVVGKFTYLVIKIITDEYPDGVIKISYLLLASLETWVKSPVSRSLEFDEISMAALHTLLALLNGIVRPVLNAKYNLTHMELYDRFVTHHIELAQTSFVCCSEIIRDGVLCNLKDFLRRFRGVVSIKGYDNLHLKMESVLARVLSAVWLPPELKMKFALLLSDDALLRPLIAPSCSLAVARCSVHSLASSADFIETSTVLRDKLQRVSVDPWKLLDDYQNGVVFPSIYISSSFSDGKEIRPFKP